MLMLSANNIGIKCMHNSYTLMCEDQIKALGAVFMQWAIIHEHRQQTGGIGAMLGWCWTIVVDDGPASVQHWTNASCLLGAATIM